MYVYITVFVVCQEQFIFFLPVKKITFKVMLLKFLMKLNETNNSQHDSIVYEKLYNKESYISLIYEFIRSVWQSGQIEIIGPGVPMICWDKIIVKPNL
jgi:hypothetical protein